MFRLDADRPAEFCDGLRRRDFLHAGTLAGLGLGLSDFLGMKAQGAVVDQDVNCILLFLVGGPSHIDTWDMKPDAPSEIRGPFRPIRTNVRGMEISENFPRMAKHADKYAIVRGVYHQAAAVHDAGHHVMQTGRLFQGGVEYPHFGCVISNVKGCRDDIPAHVLLPQTIGDTGGDMPHGQSAGFLGATFDPWRVDGRENWREVVDSSVRNIEESADPRLRDSNFHSAYQLVSSEKARAAFELRQESTGTRERYGMNRFGQGCLLARRLIEAGVRFVTVNMFETVFNEITWDIHGYKPFSPMSCYRDRVGPMFDMAYSSLLSDLHERGMLSNTMVLAMGEFGRTPKINPAGGRDHWPQCSTVLMAGGPIQGGQVVGSSDAIGGAPKGRPTTPAEIAATIYQGLGVPLDLELKGAHGESVPLVECGTKAIEELLV